MARLFFLSLLIFTATLASSEDVDLAIYTEEYPPFNFTEDGVSKGIVYDVVVSILNDLNRPDLIKEIAFVPWARGYRLAQSEPNSAIFSIVKTEEREPLFQWVGPVVKTGNVVVGHKDLIEQNVGQMLSLEQLANLKIGAVRGDIGADFISDNSVIRDSLTEVVTFPEQAAKMLGSGRIDAWSYGPISSFFIMGREGVDASNYTIIHEFEDYEMFIGFSQETPTSLVIAFQKSLNKLKKKDSNTGYSWLDTVILNYSSTANASSN